MLRIRVPKTLTAFATQKWDAFRKMHHGLLCRGRSLSRDHRKRSKWRFILWLGKYKGNVWTCGTSISDRTMCIFRRNSNLVPIPPLLVNSEILRYLDFDATRPITAFIIHGFTASISSSWMTEMAITYLSRVNLAQKSTHGLRNAV